MAFFLFYGLLITFMLQVSGLPITISTEHIPRAIGESMVLLAWEPQFPECFHLVSFEPRVTSGRRRERNLAENLLSHDLFISSRVAGIRHIDTLCGGLLALREISSHAYIVNEGIGTTGIQARSAVFEEFRNISYRDLEETSLRAVNASGGTVIKCRDGATATGGTAMSGNATTNGDDGGTATSGNASTTGEDGGTAISGDAIAGDNGNATSGDAINGAVGGTAVSGDAIVDTVEGASVTPTSATAASAAALPSLHHTSASVILGSTIGSLASVGIIVVLVILWCRRRSRFRDSTIPKVESPRMDSRPASLSSPILAAYPYPFAPNSGFPLPSGEGLPQTTAASPSRCSYLRSREEGRIPVREDSTPSTAESVDTTNGEPAPPAYQTSH